MKQYIVIGLLAVVLGFGAYFMAEETSSTDPAGPVKTTIDTNYQLPGASVLAFGPEHVLFIGDSVGASVTAVETEATELTDPIPYNLEGFDSQLAEVLGVSARDVLINDMKVHPVSQEVYVAVKIGHQPGAPAAIAIVNPITTAIRFLEVTETNSTSVTLTDPALDEPLFWNETPASALSITDIDYNEGFIYVAGLSNSEFASTLRKIPYPFDGTQTAINSLEIYHAVHTQNETRAPIRTMLFDEFNGASTLLASYTCTPLVTIPTGDITEGADITGKTIAELGYGNTPIDMLMVETQGFDGSTSKSLVVLNKNRGGSMIPYESVVAGAAGPGMAGERAMFASGLEGIQEIPTANVMHMDVQNPQMLAMIRRDIDTGGVDLVSELTGTFLRLSDFISEYDFPDYRYPEEQAGTKQYHDMVKQMEGYPNLTSEALGR
ncbi:MAG: hypothetical protein AAGA35_02525 [Patescibacteria group bacterium]